MSMWTRLRNWWTPPDSGERLVGPIPRDVWAPAAQLARARGETVPDVVKRALREYAREAGQ